MPSSVRITARNQPLFAIFEKLFAHEEQRDILVATTHRLRAIAGPRHRNGLRARSCPHRPSKRTTRPNSEGPRRGTSRLSGMTLTATKRK